MGTSQGSLAVLWPFVAVHSGTVDSRGQRILRARDLRRLSRRDVADATGVSERTIQRIEKDDVRNSRALAVLESYLGLDEAQPVADTDLPKPRPTLDPDTIEAAIQQADFLALMAEIARRYARATHQETGLAGVPERFKWYLTEAPTARRSREVNTGDEGEPDTPQQL